MVLREKLTHSLLDYHIKNQNEKIFFKHCLRNTKSSERDSEKFQRDFFPLTYYRRWKNYPKNKKSEKITIIFLVLRSECFTSVQSIYSAAAHHSSIDAWLIALPRCDREIDYSDTRNSDFCKKINSKKTIVITKDNVNDSSILKKLNPDYVFVYIPYHKHYPKPWDFTKLSQEYRICYVPYSFTSKEFLGGEYNTDILNYAYFIFANSEESFTYCREKVKRSEAITNNRVFNLGFPRMDLIDKISNLEQKKCILWMPRWTSYKQKGNAKSTFVKYHVSFLKFAEKHPEITLIIRPHPLLFSNMIASETFSEDYINQYKKQINQTKNIILDEDADYYDSFNMSSMIIADYTSLIFEYFYTKKPIVYLGSRNDSIVDDYKIDGINIASSFYYATEFKEIEKIVDNLLKNCDCCSEVREKCLEKLKVSQKNNVGESIISLIKEDFFLSNSHWCDDRRLDVH